MERLVYKQTSNTRTCQKNNSYSTIIFSQYYLATTLSSLLQPVHLFSASSSQGLFLSITTSSFSVPSSQDYFIIIIARSPLPVPSSHFFISYYYGSSSLSNISQPGSVFSLYYNRFTLSSNFHPEPQSITHSSRCTMFKPRPFFFFFFCPFQLFVSI